MNSLFLYNEDMEEKLNKLKTESRNPKSMQLDTLSSLEIVRLMNDEDKQIALAVENEMDKIACAVDVIVKQLNNHGRVLVFGAGTSGRLAVLDASEIPPTFSSFNQFIGLVAGGDEALRSSIENAEDSKDLCVEELKALHFTKNDVAIGVAASGRTPYCLGGLEYAQKLGAHSIAICCNKETAMGKVAEIAIEVEVGPEILTGSTRLKSGTAQKMVLNMLSTASMVGLGKAYSNLMVDVNPSNVKLMDRAKRIIMEATHCEYYEAEQKLIESDYRVKVAIVMILNKCDSFTAESKLEKADGFIRKTIKK